MPTSGPVENSTLRGLCIVHSPQQMGAGIQCVGQIASAQGVAFGAHCNV